MQVETDALRTPEEVEAFVNRHAGAEIKAPGWAAAYAQTGEVAGRFSYWQRSRAKKGLLRRYLQLQSSDHGLTSCVQNSWAEMMVFSGVRWLGRGLKARLTSAPRSGLTTLVTS